MGAAGIHGDVAGDGAGELARRVGRVEEAAAGDGVGDVDVGDAGLDGGDAVLVVDGKDAVEAGEADDDAVGRRQGAAGERRAGAAGDHLDVVLAEELQDRGDLLGRGRQHDGERGGAVGGERVGLVGAARVGRRNHRVGAENPRSARRRSPRRGRRWRHPGRERRATRRSPWRSPWLASVSCRHHSANPSARQNHRTGPPPLVDMKRSGLLSIPCGAPSRRRKSSWRTKQAARTSACSSPAWSTCSVRASASRRSSSCRTPAAGSRCRRRRRAAASPPTTPATAATPSRSRSRRSPRSSPTTTWWRRRGRARGC